MKSGAKFTIDGLAELDAALADMSKATARNTLRRAGKVALDPVAQAATAMAPRRSGGLAESIVVSEKLSKSQAKKARKVAKKSGAHFAEVHIGPKWPEGAHAHLVEFGTKERSYVTRSGVEVNTGSTAPHPFMRSAWDMRRSGVLKSLGQQIAAEIGKTQQRAARKAARLLKKASR